MKLKLIASLALGVLLMSGFLAAQYATSKIIGTVTDEQDNPLPGVTIVAKSPALVGTSSSITDAAGTFRILDLNPGVYTLTFTLEGFKTKVREQIIVGIEQTLSLGKVLLEIGALEEQITVIGQSPLIDVKTSTKAVNLSREVFQTLPKGRNFASLMTVLPGVNYESRTGGYSIDGGSGSENIFYVDGADTTNSRAGTQGQSVVTDFIEEVQVKASGYNAEFGGSLGGVINVVSRSGGNEFHGDIIGYLTGRNLGTKGYKTWRWDPYSTTTPPAVEWYNAEDKWGKEKWWQAEGIFSLGGYILKDRLWFFASFNPSYYTVDRPVVFTADATKTQTVYNYYEYNTDIQFKLTSQISKNLRASLSSVFLRNTTRKQLPARDGTGRMDFPYEKPGFMHPTSSGQLSLDYTLGNNFLISLRGGFWHSNSNKDQKLRSEGTTYYFGRSNVNYLDVPASLQHPSGWTNFPADRYHYNNLIRERANANLDMTYYFDLAGEHAVKGGVQWVRLHDDLDALYGYPYVYLNWNNQTTVAGQLVKGKYGYYYIYHGWFSKYGYDANVSTNRLAVYLQDSWTLNNRLTINAGLRAESEDYPIYSPAYKGKNVWSYSLGDKLSPRVSVVYDLFGDSSLKLYASYSLVYDVLKMYSAENSFGGFKWQYEYYNLDNYNWPNIAASGKQDDRAGQEAGNTFKLAYDMRWFDTSFADPNTKPVSKDEFSLGFDKKMSEEIVFSTRFVYDHLRTIIEDVGFETDIGELYYNGNPGEGWIRPVSQGGKIPDTYWAVPKAKREYAGLNLSLEKRFSNNWAAGINYTLSKLWGNCTGVANSYEGGTAATRPGATRNFDSWFMMYDAAGNVFDTVLPTDRTHYLKLYGTYRFPFGVTLGARAYIMTGLPYQKQFSLQGYAFFPEGPAEGRYEWDRWLDLYVEYNLKVFGKLNIQINANIDNVLQMSYPTSAYQVMTYRTVWVDSDTIASKTWDWKKSVQDYVPHPVFGMDDGWFSPRRTTRLGMKISW